MLSIKVGLSHGPFSKPEKGDFKCVNYNGLDLRTTIRLRLQYSLMVWMYKISMPYRGNTRESMEREPTMSREVLTMPREELTMPMEEEVKCYSSPSTTKKMLEVEKERSCADLAKPLLRVGLWQALDTTKEMLEVEGSHADLAKPLLRVGLWQDLDWINSNPNYIY